ncbi:MAG: S8 family peptidase [Clostridiales bacterium]|jgi:subtilisin family serine protease|nr:S8 family peptidase [Clostridiales bacterium]
MPITDIVADMPLQDFILSSNTSACVIRRNNFLNPEIRDNPNIRLGKVLNGNYMICYARNDMYDTILEDTRIFHRSVLCGLLAQIDLETTGISSIQQLPSLNLRGEGVLLGFVDTGIDYRNDAFRWENGETRIVSMWDMTVHGNPPETFNFGQEYTEEQINAALHTSDPLNLVPFEDNVGHGTFLASVSGSREGGTYQGVAPDAEFVIVKLKEASPGYRQLYLVPEDQYNLYESTDIMLGIEYLITTARNLNRPIAICIGLGTNLTGHDGFSMLEDYITSISHENGVALCCAAGNEVTKKRHARGEVQETGSITSVDIQVGQSGKSIYITLWNSSNDRFSVSVTSPSGETISRPPARSGGMTTTRLILESSLVTIGYVFPYYGNGSQLTKIQIHFPTPGIWRINVYGEVVLEGPFDIWLPLGLPEAVDAEFLSPDPYYTITVPGTAIGVICCGAYNSRDKSLYYQSSWGPSRITSILPNLVAPGVEVSGILPSGYGVMTGTSVSAAFAQGVCALLLQWGLINGNVTSMNTYNIRSILIQGCDRDANINYPNEQWGYGRLNLYNSFLQMRSM